MPVRHSHRHRDPAPRRVPTLSIVSAVVTAASGAETIGLVARLIRRGRSGATTESIAIPGAPNRVEAGTDRADGITTDEPGRASALLRVMVCDGNSTVSLPIL